MFKTKRLLALLLAGMMAMSVTACSKSGKDEDDDDDDDRPSKSAGKDDDNGKDDDGKVNDWDDFAKEESKDDTSKIESIKVDIAEPEPVEPSKNEDYGDVLEGIIDYVEKGDINAIKSCITHETLNRVEDLVTSLDYDYSSLDEYFTEVYEESFDVGDMELEAYVSDIEELDEYDLQDIIDYYYVDMLGYSENVDIDKGYLIEVEYYVYDEDGYDYDEGYEYFTIARINNEWELTLY